MRYNFDEYVIKDIIYDGTAVFPKMLLEINYIYSDSQHCIEE